jgi:hypothetical protein
MRLTVTGVESDQGSIVLLQGIEYETDREVVFGADHRPAQDIIWALEQGEDVEVEIEGWQVVRSLPAGYLAGTASTNQEDTVTQPDQQDQPEQQEQGDQDTAQQAQERPDAPDSGNEVTQSPAQQAEAAQAQQDATEQDGGNQQGMGDLAQQQDGSGDQSA